MAYSVSHDIVIIGRNIAGLGAAYVLGSAGHKVTIVGEKTCLYGGFQLAPNGFTALEVLGLRPQIDAGASYINSIQVKSLERSERLAEVKHDSANLYAGVSRQHILDCLIAATANLPVAIEQTRLKALDLDEGMAKARLLLETGEIITPKLIIGADGNNGLCRATVTGYQPQKPSLHILHCGLMFQPARSLIHSVIKCVSSGLETAAILSATLSSIKKKYASTPYIASNAATYHQAFQTGRDRPLPVILSYGDLQINA